MNKQFYLGEIRSLGENVIEGKALSFEVESKILCEDGIFFTETLKRGCITQETINKSNIILTYNHQTDDLLARSNKGVGTLQIDLREDGLYFKTQIPQTRFGAECYERVIRGDISECSFCFTVKDEDQIWTRNGEIPHRDILKIDELFDLAIVINPAYPETMCSARSQELKAANEKISQKEQISEKTQINNKEDDSSDFQDDAETQTEDRKEEQVESCENVPEEQDETCSDSSDFQDDAELQAKEETEKQIEKEKRNITNSMKKDITLVQQIRNAMDSNEKRVNISLEKRTMTVNKKNGEGSDPYAVKDTAIVEEYQALIEPLYENQVLGNLGIKMFTGVPKGDYNFPVIGKGTCGFASEIAKAVESGNTTTNVHLSPKRICGYVDISKQLLMQDTIGINNAIRKDLFNALADAIQAAILDNAAKSDVRPAGILNSVDPTTITTFKDLCELEAGLEDVHFDNVKYLVSNKAYAALRNLPKSAKTTELVLENGTIDGVAVVKTGALADKTIVLADFSQLALAMWGDADLVVDEISQAVNGCVRLVINAYVDWTWVRPNAYKVATIA